MSLKVKKSTARKHIRSVSYIVHFCTEVAPKLARFSVIKPYQELVSDFISFASSVISGTNTMYILDIGSRMGPSWYTYIPKVIRELEVQSFYKIIHYPSILTIDQGINSLIPNSGDKKFTVGSCINFYDVRDNLTIDDYECMLLGLLEVSHNLYLTIDKHYSLSPIGNDIDTFIGTNIQPMIKDVPCLVSWNTVRDQLIIYIIKEK